MTTFKRPVANKPAVLGKLAGSSSSGDVNNWDLGLWEKFGPGGFRSFNDTLGPEVCQRPGLFRHPAGSEHLSIVFLHNCEILLNELNVLGLYA